MSAYMQVMMGEGDDIAVHADYIDYTADYTVGYPAWIEVAFHGVR